MINSNICKKRTLPSEQFFLDNQPYFLFLKCFLTLIFFSFFASNIAFAEVNKDICESTDIAEVPTAQCQSLVDLYLSTGGDSWLKNNGWLQAGDPCNWYGITCNSQSEIAIIDLKENNLSGQINASLSSLIQLERLHLSNNSLTGSIPTSIVNNVALSSLSLEDNNLNGELPDEIGQLSTLSNLRIQNNQLQGSIPASIGSLTSLTVFYFQNNQFSGEIPASIGQLNALTDLRIHDNNLTGTIPDSLAELVNLRVFSLYNNQLTGHIPASIGQLSQAVSIRLNNNQLTGSIPSFTNSPLLKVLMLQNNQLTGHIPASIGQLSQAVSIRLNNNQLTGSIPSFTNSSLLKVLMLQNNQLTGSIPTSLSNLSSLEDLVLSNNQLSGELPSGLSNLSNFTFFQALNNSGLIGAIPLSYTSLNFSSFYFSNTDLCLPMNNEFKVWYEAISNKYPLPDCDPQTSPKISAPDDITVIVNNTYGVNASHPDITLFLESATATDIEDGAINVLNNAPEVFSTGMTNVVFLATDSVGNTGTASATVTINVIDESAPIITPPTNITLTSNSNDGLLATHTEIAAFLIAATAEDNLDESIVVTNNAPAIFNIGITTVLFTAQDAKGNTSTASATVTINVIDESAPIIIPPTNITLTSNSNDGLLATHTEIASFLTAATAEDNLDESIVVTNNAPAIFNIGITTVLFIVEDAAGNTARANATVTINYEANEDSKPPKFDELKDIEIYARGIMTNIKKDIEALNIVAFDDIDGQIKAYIIGKHVLLSGAHQVELAATDKSGNTAIAQLTILIHPKVSISHSHYVSAGESIDVSIQLNGNGARYPINVTFDLEGAGFVNGPNTVNIIEGDNAFIRIIANDDATHSDHIKVRLTGADNASLANNSTSVINIIEANIPPALTLNLKQKGKQTDIIGMDKGIITLSVDIDDINKNDTHTIKWSSEQNIVDFSQAKNQTQLVFDPSFLDEGAYKITVAVTENNTDELVSISTEKQFIVHQKNIVLSDTTDTDNDGVTDAEEGTADLDGDGIADYMDNDDDTSRLPTGDTNVIMQVSAGLKLGVGSITSHAKSGLANSAAVTTADLLDITQHADAMDEAFEHQNSIIDFIISGLPIAGDSVAIIIPLEGNKTIPADAVYRKFHPVKGWYEFVVNENNQLTSAKKDSDGNCPESYSEQYQIGLNQGDECIQLLIEDGGQNDNDEQANGIIEDPGVLAIDVVNNAPEVTLAKTILIVAETTKVSLNASSSIDPDNTELSFIWQQTLGTEVQLSQANTAIAKFTAPEVNQDEELIFEVTVSDGVNDTRATVVVNITNVNQAPLVSIDTTPLPVEENRTITLKANGTDIDNQNLTYQWQQISDINLTLSGTTSSTLTVTTPQVDQNTIVVLQVTVSDGQLESQSQVKFSITNAVISPEQISQNETSSGGSTFYLLIWLMIMVVFRRNTGNILLLSEFISH